MLIWPIFKLRASDAAIDNGSEKIKSATRPV